MDVLPFLGQTLLIAFLEAWPFEAKQPLEGGMVGELRMDWQGDGATTCRKHPGTD